MSDINTINELDVIDPDDIPDMREILLGNITTISNCDLPICYEIMNDLVTALLARYRELNVPKTSDEANILFMAEFDNLVSFMQQNFPIEMSITTVTKLLAELTLPNVEIAHSDKLTAFIVEYSDFLK